MKLHCLVLLSLLVLPLVALAGGPTEPLVGGWTPIKNVTDPHVTEIANFAVTEYNKQSGAKLQCERVIKGETQVVAGFNYRLVLAAKDDRSTSNNYEAVVWEKTWEHFRNLTSFKPVQ